MSLSSEFLCNQCSEPIGGDCVTYCPQCKPLHIWCGPCAHEIKRQKIKCKHCKQFRSQLFTLNKPPSNETIQEAVAVIPEKQLINVINSVVNELENQQKHKYHGRYQAMADKKFKQIPILQRNILELTRQLEDKTRQFNNLNQKYTEMLMKNANRNSSNIKYIHRNKNRTNQNKNRKKQYQTQPTHQRHQQNVRMHRGPRIPHKSMNSKHNYQSQTSRSHNQNENDFNMNNINNNKKRKVKHSRHRSKSASTLLPNVPLKQNFNFHDVMNQNNKYVNSNGAISSLNWPSNNNSNNNSRLFILDSDPPMHSNSNTNNTNIIENMWTD